MRRRWLLAVAGGVGLAGLAGCVGSGTDAADGDTTTTAVPELAAPSDRVGSEPYLATLRARIDADGFPAPDPDLIPLLTEARFVADAARAAGNAEFASSVSELRDPVFDPLERFDETVGRTDETEIDDPTAYLEERLDRRERTFLDYPAPPHHFIEAAETRGRERTDVDARREELREAVGDESPTYVDHRATVEAVVAGGVALGRETYEERADRGFPSGVEYDSRDHYADVVAFNGALAAEAMLEHNGEIVTPP